MRGIRNNKRSDQRDRREVPTPENDPVLVDEDAHDVNARNLGEWRRAHENYFIATGCMAGARTQSEKSTKRKIGDK